MKTYLITGGAGFIGCNFIHHMLERNSDIFIINLDKLTYAGSTENLKEVEGDSRYIFVKGDICSKDTVRDIFTDYDIDYVVHFAAESHVDRSITGPEIFAVTNVLGTLNLLNTAKEAWETADGFKEGKKFIQISTDEVYGSLGDTGCFTEGTPLSPRSPYSASKAGADMMVKAFYDTYKMPVNITRCSNNYGPYQYPEKLIPLVINCCLDKRSIPVYGDGLNVRDWVYVTDHCRAVELVINRGRTGEIYNIGGRAEKTNIDIIKTVIGYINKNIDSSVTEDLIKYIADRKGHDRRYAMDPSKIENELGWNAQMNFEEGIIKTIKWYADNKEW